MKSLNECIELDGKFMLSMRTDFLDPRPAQPNFHWHYELEMSMVKQGQGVYLVDDKSYDIQAGDIFVFNNIEYHGIGVDSPEGLINTVISFDPSFILNIGNNLFDARYLKIFFERNQHFENRLDRSNPATGEIRQLFLEMEEEFQSKPPEYELMIKVKFLNILVALIRHYGYTRTEEEEPGRNRHDLTYINKVIDYISANLANDIRLEDLAGITFMNPSYFSTFFKKYTGVSPSEYITGKRIQRAVELLRASDRTVLDIAGLCGFNSASNFNKLFKKVTGKTPSDFR